MNNLELVWYYFGRRQMWEGNPAAGKPLRQKGGVETHRGWLHA